MTRIDTEEAMIQPPSFYKLFYMGRIKYNIYYYRT
jgi:hypothetical protein